jgi:hypothetical protein
MANGKPAVTVQDIINSTSYSSNFESGTVGGFPGSSPSGAYTSGSAAGYTQGPNYFGKTFWIWPPIPDGKGGSTTIGRTIASTGLSTDWRKAFFLQSNQTSPVISNTSLFNQSGQWLPPKSGGTVNYYINYSNILKWLALCGQAGNPNPFPSQLQSGGILYYSAIPSYTDGTLNARWWAYNGTLLSNLDEQFWKDYIDWVIGSFQFSSSSWASNRNNLSPDPIQGQTQYAGYGGDFSWTGGGAHLPTIGSSNAPQYMNYADNPQRPLFLMWFGPASMVDFLGSYNMWGPTNYQRSNFWPGTAHEAVTYVCKLGLQAAIQDSNNNHPNDNFALAYYSVPMDGVNPSDPQMRFNRIRTPMGQNYTSAINHLWYPPYVLDNPGTTIRPYDTVNNPEAPRAQGGTCAAYGMLLAYNQFSANTTIQTYNPSPAPLGDAGGLGRIGAQKLLIMETDGQPNVEVTATKNTGGGTGKYYYQICYNSTTPSGSQFPGVQENGSDNSNTYATAMASDFSSTRKPMKIYCIAFGPVYDPANTSVASIASAGMTILTQLQTTGNNSGVAVPTIYGSDSAMANGLQTAITNIMQSEIPVSLIK